MLRIKVDRNNQIVARMDHVYEMLGDLCDFVIAGGAPLSVMMGKSDLGSSDIDLWFPDVANFSNAKAYFESRSKAFKSASSSNAETFFVETKESTEDEPKFMTVQCICRSYHTDMADVLASFDLSVCKVGYYDGYCYLVDQAFTDITDLAIRKTENESIITGGNGKHRAIRFVKYATKGFDIDEELILQSRELGYFDGTVSGSISADGSAY